MTAAEVLRRYEEELLPEFLEVALVDVNQVGRFGNPPLSVAAVRGSVDEVLALLDGGAVLDTRGEHGHTALHDAAGQGHAAVVRVLLDRGANPTIRNEWGATPLEVAARANRTEIVALLLAAAEL